MSLPDVYPKVSIVTPTYNRHAFIPQLLRCAALQDYPHERLELLILDDSPQAVTLPADPARDFEVKLIRADQRMTLGTKRNLLNDLAGGEIIVAFDDDDYYPPQRVSHAVQSLRQSGLELAGSTYLPMWFPHSPQVRTMYLLGPYGPYHSCNGALAYTKAYSQQFRYDSTRNSGEEPGFTNNFRHPMVQLKPELTMLSISHRQNTVPKPEQNFAQYVLPNRNYPEFPFANWQDFVQDKESREFYKNLFNLR